MVTLGVGGACFSRGGIGYMGTCRTTGVASVLFLLRSTGFSWTGGPSAWNQKKNYNFIIITPLRNNTVLKEEIK